MDDLLTRLRDPRYIGQEFMRASAADEIERLRAALEGLIKRHAELVESGDCGFWDVETEPEMIAARKVLANEQTARNI